MPVDLRVLEPAVLQIVNDTVSSKETLRVKILLKGEEENPLAVRVEIFSDSDYFFLYTSQYALSTFKLIREDDLSFSELKKKLKLKVNFPDYPTVLIKMFNNSMKDPNRYIQLNNLV